MHPKTSDYTLKLVVGDNAAMTAALKRMVADEHVSAEAMRDMGDVLARRLLEKDYVTVVPAGVIFIIADETFNEGAEL